MKKILSILLCVCMLTGICGQSVSAASKVSWTGSPGVNKESAFQFEGGNGTVDSPYLIATADQLNAMRQDSAAHYKLIADIDDADKCRALFDDLCTVKELENMAERLYAAKLLMEGKTYNQVIAETDISSATLSRISRCVQYGQGYTNVLKEK